ncbi:hypothetical protein CCR97_10690 [Rhodoplanes elegans]|uniref:Sodium:sulfate symporter n=1 Tax=Rhodoplanes elegans TaxID=29408 RepID=A0A327KGH4_9BRAD|nr:SLC13 family permease [Rhodoplanes elegans]MBK5958674.1 hypothetical protein [Rhodoplanes elegans]RAI37244.1 hypothetical protein CH338_16445 [Rhodoplanes elegans]
MGADKEKLDVIKIIRIVGSLAAIAIGVYVGTLPPPDGLTTQAMYALGITICAVGWWMTQLVPEYVTGLMMCTLWVAFGAVPFPRAFYNFSTPGWWIMVGAFGLGAVAGRVGLLKRISLWVLSLVPPTFKGQVLGLVGSGIIISPLVPSMNAKAALSSPMALAISDSLGLPRKSAAAAGMLGACYLGYVIMGHIFLSGSFSHYALIAALPKEFQNVSWMDWLLWSLPWGLVVGVGMTVAILILYAPKEKVALPANYGKEALAKIGPMTKDEKIVLAVLICALLMWMTEGYHKINSGVVAVTAMCTLLGVRTMTANDFKNGIEWPAVMLIGSVFNMASVIGFLKIDKYLGSLLGPFLDSVIRQPVLFVAFMAISVYGLKFLLTNMTSMSVMFAMILSPLLVPLGVNPWIVIFVTFCAGGIWVLRYTNTIYMCAQFGTKDEMATDGQMVKLTFVYMVLIVLGAVVSIPWWKMLGLM